MNGEYEQLNITSEDISQKGNEKRNTSSHFREIIQSKNSLRKYIIILSAGGLLIILTIYLVSVSSYLSEGETKKTMSYSRGSEGEDEEIQLTKQFSKLSYQKNAGGVTNREGSGGLKNEESEAQKLVEENERNVRFIAELQMQNTFTRNGIKENEKKLEETKSLVITISKNNSNRIGVIESLKEEIAEIKDKIKQLSK